MDFSASEKTRHWLERLRAFMDENVFPNEKLYHEQLHAEPLHPWIVPAILPELQARAREAGRCIFTIRAMALA